MRLGKGKFGLRALFSHRLRPVGVGSEERAWLILFLRWMFGRGDFIRARTCALALLFLLDQLHFFGHLMAGLLPLSRWVLLFLLLETFGDGLRGRIVVARASCVSAHTSQHLFLVLLLDELPALVFFVPKDVLVRGNTRCVREHNLLQES